MSSSDEKIGPGGLNPRKVNNIVSREMTGFRLFIEMNTEKDTQQIAIYHKDATIS